MTVAEPGMDVPLFSQCVLGYRMWVADEHDQLWPIAAARRPWTPGINTARCGCRTWPALRFEWSLYEGRRVLEPAPAHLAPEGTCECGLYSWRRPDPKWSDPGVLAPPRVVGAVASWGRIQVHDRGFRAEHACVVTLAQDSSASDDDRAVLERIAARYHVELVPLTELERAASRHGTPLPDDLRPSPAVAWREDPQPRALTPRSGADAPLALDEYTRAMGGRASHLAPPAARARKPGWRRGALIVAVLLSGVAAAGFGLVALAHPVFGWSYGQAHTSDLPPALGVGLLAWAAVAFGVSVWWLSDELWLRVFVRLVRRESGRARTAANSDEGRERGIRGSDRTP